MRAKVEIVFRRKVRAIWLDHGMALAAQGLPWNDAKPALVDASRRRESRSRNHSQSIGACSAESGLSHRTTAPSFALPHWSCSVPAIHRPAAPCSTGEWRLPPTHSSAARAKCLGRLLKLQKEARRADVQRRLREQYGDRDFVNRIARYTVSSFLDWGVIAETKKAGVYLPGKKNQCRSGEQLAWLAEAVLISRGETQVRFSQLCNHPLLFPFSVETFNASILRANPRLKVARQGLNEDFVFLETTIAQPVQLSCPKHLSPALP